VPSLFLMTWCWTKFWEVFALPPSQKQPPTFPDGAYASLMSPRSASYRSSYRSTSLTGIRRLVAHDNKTWRTTVLNHPSQKKKNHLLSQEGITPLSVSRCTTSSTLNWFDGPVSFLFCSCSARHKTPQIYVTVMLISIISMAHPLTTFMNQSNQVHLLWWHSYRCATTNRL
jgi:hypothetical protein